METVIADLLSASECVDGLFSEYILSFYLLGLVPESQGKVAKVGEVECERQQKISNIISCVSPLWVRWLWVRDFVFSFLHNRYLDG